MLPDLLKTSIFGSLLISAEVIEFDLEDPFYTNNFEIIISIIHYR